MRPSLLLAPILFLLALAGTAGAADRGKLEAFLSVTGYDVVIESLQQGAMAGPGMVGDAPQTFGREYTALAKNVFDPDVMVHRATDILEAVLPEDLLNAGADFYASDLGQRLVKVENAAHLADSATKLSEGQTLLEKMQREDPERLQMLQDMNDAIGSKETGQRAAVEIQLRFLMAATQVGAMQQGPSEDDLRAMLMAQVKENEPRTELYGLVSNAYTYREISDDDMRAYLDALESEPMRKLYEVLNGVQYQVMMERYQALGERLGELKPQQEL